MLLCPSCRPALATAHLPPRLSPRTSRTAGEGGGSLQPVGTVFPLGHVSGRRAPWVTPRLWTARSRWPVAHEGRGAGSGRGSHRSTGTLVGFFSSDGAALLRDRCPGPSCRAARWLRTAFFKKLLNCFPEQLRHTLPPATSEGPSVLGVLAACRFGRLPCVSPKVHKVCVYLPSLYPPRVLCPFCDRLIVFPLSSWGVLRVF